MTTRIAAMLRRLAAGAGLALALAAGAAPPLPAGTTDWTRVVPEPTTFLGRDANPSCSALPIPGTSPQYHFWAKRGTDRNLVVFFEGGGACWDAFTCGLVPGVAPTFVPFITPDQDPRIASGLFDLANPRNPLRNASFVYVPYCTGDLHAGARDQVIDTPLGPVPVRHRGFDNFLAVLKWTTENFDDPKKILVAGSSAGGYGALLNFPWIEQVYPKAKTYVFQDASQGVNPEAWNAIRDAAWNLQIHPTVSAGERTPIAPERIVQRTLQSFEKTKFSQYTTAWDGVQRVFYGLQLLSVGQAPPGGQSVCAGWNGGMLAGLGLFQQEDNFRSYLAAGEVHTILRSPTLYSEASAGLPVINWLNAMVRSEGGLKGHGGLPWANVSCAGDCGRPAPAQCP